LFGAYEEGFPVSPLVGLSGGVGGAEWVGRAYMLGGITAPATGGGPYLVVGLEIGAQARLQEQVGGHWLDP
jgi:hypothetical protein